MVQFTPRLCAWLLGTFYVDKRCPGAITGLPSCIEEVGVSQFIVSNLLVKKNSGAPAFFQQIGGSDKGMHMNMNKQLGQCHVSPISVPLFQFLLLCAEV